MVEILWIFLDVELKSIMSDGYNVYVFIGDELKSARFKDTVHPICMFHANNKFVKAANQRTECGDYANIASGKIILAVD